MTDNIHKLKIIENVWKEIVKEIEISFISLNVKTMNFDFVFAILIIFIVQFILTYCKLHNTILDNVNILLKLLTTKV